MLAGSFVAFAQAPHIYEHDYPVITAENPLIRSLMDSVSLDSINANIEHLSGYHTRRYDSRFIYDVQDWLVSRYKTFGVDTVMLHDFEVPYFEQGTANNIIDGFKPSAAYMLPLVEKALREQDFVDVAYFEPFYLKDFIAGKPHVKGLV